MGPDQSDRATHVSLEQLATLADPPMTKDVVAGKLRRLLALADRCAACLNLPSTPAAVTVELLDAADQERRTSQSAARYPRYPLGGAMVTDEWS